MCVQGGFGPPGISIPEMGGRESEGERKCQTLSPPSFPPSQASFTSKEVKWGDYKSTLLEGDQQEESYPAVPSTTHARSGFLHTNCLYG